MRTLKRIAAVALTLTFVCVTAAVARQQQNPNSLGSGGGTASDTPPSAGKPSDRAEAKSAQGSMAEAKGQEPAGPRAAPKPIPRRRRPRNRGARVP